MIKDTLFYYLAIYVEIKHLGGTSEMTKSLY